MRIAGASFGGLSWTRILRSLVLPLLPVVGAACGGDDSWTFPLWVETDVVVADVNRDGRSDVLTLAQLATSMSQREGRLTVYLQTETGAFAQPDTYIVGRYPWTLAVDDIDGDGGADGVVVDVDERVTWLLLQDAGSLGIPRKIARDVNAYDVAIADLNGDGAPDVAIADSERDANRLVLLYQSSEQRGTFLPPTDVPLPWSPTHVTTGDVDGDGLADALTWISRAGSDHVPSGKLALALQGKDGSLGLATTLAPQTGLNAVILALADYQGDGHNDIIVLLTGFDLEYPSKLTVLLQDPIGGRFSPPADTPLAGIPIPDDAVVADLDANDRPDVAAIGTLRTGSPSRLASQVTVLTPSGAGRFAVSKVYTLPSAAGRIAAGDVDGDGRNDLVVFGGDHECAVLVQSHSVPGDFGPPRRLR